jgi:hypothetical protein
MSHPIDYYREQLNKALLEAERPGNADRAGWIRIAAEWQKLLDALPKEAGPETHLID